MIIIQAHSYSVLLLIKLEESVFFFPTDLSFRAIPLSSPPPIPGHHHSIYCLSTHWLFLLSPWLGASYSETPTPLLYFPQPILSHSSLLTQTPLEKWLSCYLFSFWSLLVQVQVLGYSWNLLVSLNLVKSSGLGTDGQVSSTCTHHQTANHRLILGFPLVICKMKV